MKIIIHPGMHKTGSSAIQEALYALNSKDFAYAKWNSSNHSGMFALLFLSPERAANYHGFRARGEAYVRSLPELREKWLANLERQLRTCGKKPFVFSAEDISSPMHSEAAREMGAFFKRFSSDIQVIAYARPPHSYAVSACQQRLKGGTLKRLNLGVLWPFYRKRFQTLDEVFGEENVILRPYVRASLKDGDVVADFLHVSGLPGNPAKQVEANVSLSAEATALLYMQRMLGAGYVSGSTKAIQADARFVEALRTIGTRKFSFHPDVWTPVLEENEEDLLWIERRLGAPLRDAPDPRSILIRDENDLFDLALSCRAEIEALAVKMAETGRSLDLDQTVAALELVRRLC